MGLIRIKVSFILSILMFNPILQAQQTSCLSFLNLSIKIRTEKTSLKDENPQNGQAFFNRIKEALVLTQSARIEVPTPEELKKLKAPSRLMTALKKLTLVTRSSFGSTFWLTLEPKVFSNLASENKEFIKEVEVVFEELNGFFSYQNFDYFYPILAKGQNGAFVAKTRLALKLKQLQYFLSLVFDKPINLFEEEGWLTVFEIEELGQLVAKIKENEILNQELHLRIKQHLNVIPSPRRLVDGLTEFFFGTYHFGYSEDALGFLSRSVDRSMIEDLIRELRLGKRLEDKYLADLELLSHVQVDPAYLKPSGYVLLYFKAYLENHKSIPGFTDVNIERRAFYPRLFLSLYNASRRNKIIRAIEDEKFASYVESSESLNERHKSLELRFVDLRQRYPKFNSEISKLELELNDIPLVLDFGIDLKSVDIKLREIEILIDHLVEKILENTSLESIKLFQDLNYRWERLIPMQSYELIGLDYTHVVFTKKVIDHFKHDPILGARFLAALTKSYVPMKGSSGLRKLPGLHDEFRDIKLIKSGGKLRLVGRKINKTIYFFYIYESNLGYDNKLMTQIIEQYQP